MLYSATRKSFFYGLIILLFVTIILLISHHFMFIGSNIKEEENSDVSINEYQFLKVNRFLEGEGDEIYRGTSTSAKSLDKDDSPFFFDRITGEDGKEQFTLISRFGSTEYQCFGTCFCEKDDRRTSYFSSSSSSTLTKSVFYLVAAFSIPLAIDHASDYFKEYCIVKMSEDEEGCEPSSIKSSTDECSPVGSTTSSIVKGIREVYEREPQFMCKGRCTLYEGLEHLGEHKIKDKRLRSMCGKIEQTAVYDLKVLQFPPSVEMARDEFIMNHLEPYCMKSSVMDEETRSIVMDELGGMGNSFLVPEIIGREVTMVPSGDPSICQSDRESVQCRLLEDD